MRAVGYSLPTAIADIIDNSVSAGASEIAINYTVTGSAPYIAILDNGSGMSPSEARQAMQLAGSDSTAPRSPSDLGRFGLGLKTASISQCRRLTVVAKQQKVLTALVWDLDHLAATGSWSLGVLSESEMRELPHFDELAMLEAGTLVIWSSLDRFHAETRQLSTEVDAQMIETRNHLSLIFHQFLNGDGRPKIAMSINGKPLAGLDPFLSKSSGGQRSGIEMIELDGEKITVQVFTLPFINRMSTKDRELALAPGSIRDSQGFYVYRGGRLVIWGTWFRLMPKMDSSKLARVKVEIPNTLDHLWSLDIKKSAAVPPVAVRDRLRQMAAEMAKPSEKVFKFRGRKAKQDDPVERVWNLIEDRDTFRYEINRDHPLLQALGGGTTGSSERALEEALQTIESMYPAQDLFNRMGVDKVVLHDTDQDAQAKQTLTDLWTLRTTSAETMDDFLARMTRFEPWDRFVGRIDELRTHILQQLPETTDE